MLLFNLTRVLELRGVDKPHAFLTRGGFTRQAASSLINNRATQINIHHLERLCTLLNCAPNDLFEWRADKNSTVAENHSLRTLAREKNAASLRQIITDIPLDKMEKAGELLAEIAKNQ